MTPSTNPLPSDPALDELREAYATGNLILFAGAGLSAAAGLPGWKKLVELLVERARARLAAPEQLQEITGLLNDSKLIDALTAARQALGGPDFHAAIERALDDQRREVPEAARAIAALAPGLRAVITTNLDRLLERAFGGEWPALARAPADLAQRRHYILKLHGTLSEYGTWVFTREDYDRAMYADPGARTAFTALFHTCPLLFVGYGLSDDDFDAVLGRVRAWAGGQPPRHFALVDRATVKPYRQRKLEDAGLRLIPYDNPDGTHSAVALVLRSLSAGPASAPAGAPPATAGTGAAPIPPSPSPASATASVPVGPAAPAPASGAAAMSLAEDLRRAIRGGDVLFLVGSGVSVGATGRNPWASWPGLVKDGIAECEKATGLGAETAELYRKLVETGRTGDLLRAAQLVTDQLGGPGGGDFRAWLRRTVGSLRASHRDVLEALRALPGLLATTNYDGVLEEVTGLPAVTWRQSHKVERVLRGDEKGIVHLHGYWDDSESVVLGIRDYQRLLGNEHAQAMLRAIRSMKTLVFVGCGEGLADPNFGALLEWARGVFAGSEDVHYRLALEREADKLRQQHRGDRIRVVPYGADFGALAPFLRSLAG